MYKGYKLRDALDEYAITFFALLSEGYRQQARDYQILASIYSVPNMSPESRVAFLKQLEFATKDASDILNNEGDTNAIGDLKKMLG